MTKPPRDPSEAELLRFWISINHDAIDAYLERVVAQLREALATALKEELVKPTSKAAPLSLFVTAQASPAGVQLDPKERLKAVDLRTALLMGKIPEDTGLLIDHKTAAKLLNVSPRTLYRLHDLGATPDPLRIGGKIIRFRLAELLAWIEADCPLRRDWSYSQDASQKKRRK